MDILWNNQIIKQKLLFNFPLEVLYKIKKNHKITSSKDVIPELKKIFQLSKEGSKEHQLILGDLLLSIHHPDVIKNNETGKLIEKKIASIFSAKRNDEESIYKDEIISNIDHPFINNLNSESRAKLESNIKQKPDLIFEDGSMISCKTGIPTNDEINLGSFEFQNVIDDPIFENFRGLQERRRSITINDIENCGLGSATQLSNFSEALKKVELFEIFQERFECFFGEVFREDLFFYHKNPMDFDIWLVKNKDLKEMIFQNVKNNFRGLRWESNCIRTRHINEIKNRSDRITFEFQDYIDVNFIINYFAK